MASEGRLIEAAGGVLWRPAADGGGAEVCIVHRPKYDDWSVPKGKLDRGEHVLLAAAREVREETGFTATVGRPLGEIRYLKDGAPKRVRFWAMQLASGEFAPNDEVDRLLWLSPTEALTVLSPDRDPSVVEAFAADTSPTVPLVILRHASAGDPAAWGGDDTLRPLDDTGREQADRLAEVLILYGAADVVSADVVRCTETVLPFADKSSLTVHAEPLLSEAGFAQNPAATADRLLEIAASRTPMVLCSQGTVIPALVSELCKAYGFPVPRDPSLRKSDAWVAHLAVGEDRIVALEQLTVRG
jgi:8-oxo-dGTP diphosphatase